ncbi:type II secretion system F family protein [Aquabacterium sp.]|uniref:type II secretion system F family protein n=1 Tax=Aquabacterium sp. TaxID=1872578 RepID=UPI002487F13C|nr:type II secretion system F family protein [Aquabacterium sp.]MDI1350775.1 type II secretion system F family protein [Aquabacterium sp.]
MSRTPVSTVARSAADTPVPRSRRLAAVSASVQGRPGLLQRLQGQQVSQRRVEFPRRLFCQELAVLLDAGIPLYEAIATLCEKEESADVARVLNSLTTDLSEGRTLSQAMRQQPQAFSSLLIASIEASQRTGQTAEALRQHAAYLTWLTGLRDKLVSAAIYPAILIGASLVVISFLTVFVVPRFADIYEGMGGEMPWASAVLLGIGKGVGDHPWLTLGGLVGVGMAIAAAWKAPVVRAAVSERLWRTPVIGPRLRLIELASLYRTLGLLLQAGVAVVPALEASLELVGPSLRPSMTQATRRVREGARLSDALQRHHLTTPVSVRMMRVGEQTGELGPMLERAATFYDEELARFTEWVGKVVSPALMLIMGVLIGGIVVLMYLPIFQVADQIQ